MLDISTVNAAVNKAALGAVRSLGLRHVQSTPGADEYGDAALRVTLVLDDATANNLTGDNAIAIRLDIQDELQRLGEERFAFVTFTTEGELAQDDDPES